MTSKSTSVKWSKQMIIAINMYGKTCVCTFNIWTLRVVFSTMYVLFILWFWKEKSQFSYEVTIWCFILFVTVKFLKRFAAVLCVYMVWDLHGLGLTLRVTVNSIMKLIYTPCKCKCIKFIYICVSVNVEYEMRKCKNKFIYIILHGPIKKCKCKKIYIYIILHGSVKHV